MAAFTCPNCKQQTNRLLWPPVARGDEPKICCPACRDSIGAKPDKKLYTGRKIWAGRDCMTPNQLEESNHNFGQSLLESAEKNRRRGII